jgi:hypothetical protein
MLRFLVTGLPTRATRESAPERELDHVEAGLPAVRPSVLKPRRQQPLPRSLCTSLKDLGEL